MTYKRVVGDVKPYSFTHSELISYIFAACLYSWLSSDLNFNMEIMHAHAEFVGESSGLSPYHKPGCR